MIRYLTGITMLTFLSLVMPQSITACDYGSYSTKVSIDGQDITLGFDFQKNWQDCRLGLQCTITNSEEYFYEPITEFSDTMDFPWDEFIITLPDDIDPNEVIISCRLDKPTKSIEKPDAPAREQTQKHEVVIRADPLGGYRTMGKINGRKTNFIIDTGASLVFLSKTTAKKLKVRYGKNRPIRVQTASGFDIAYLATIKKISIGKIVLHDIQAAISTHDFPRCPLLGMSFLEQLELSHEGNKMIIRKKH